MRRRHDWGAASLELSLLVTGTAAALIAGLALMGEDVEMLFNAAAETVARSLG